ncbi:solute carrier family 12 member 2-like isoform X2 [Mytilus edulis]|uniref:solute carrier family 12 member 2-like isoform X2 n=1 Tax=Mytilus edulis TaxID=6550 RepID=UPI0039EE10BB
MTEMKVNGSLGAGEPSDTLDFRLTEGNMKKVPSSSRFQVARVDFAEPVDKEAESDAEDTIDRENENRGDRYQRQDSHRDSINVYIDTISPTATYQSVNANTNHKTFGKYTTEALPHVDHYRNLLSATNALKSRPTLAELHEEKGFNRSAFQDESDSKGKPSEPLLSNAVTIEDGKPSGPTAVKFGWIKGVLVRCLLNIWGVMLFLRLSWVVGQAGTGLTSVIILLSVVVTLITSVSMSAICTNGEVKGGGAYFMISRSLGPEFGGAIGLIFSVANAVAVAMYVVGFAETVRDILKEHDALMIDEVNDIRIIGILTTTFLLVIAIIGMEWEARAQMVLLVALLIALVNFIIGTFIPPSKENVDRGIIGYNSTLFVENLKPQFIDGESFFSVFSVFFPAATGILAGANISGDLKNPQKDIPKGTILAILISSVVYIVVAWILGATVIREIPLTVCSSVLVNNTLNSDLVTSDNITSTIANCTVDPTSLFGLLHDYQAMEKMSGFGPLITIGIFSATLSSALASLVSAPKVFQAVCKDKIFPKIDFFAKGYGVSDNPRRAYILAYFIGVAFVCIGDLNAIAPIISNFFLMAYTLINYAVFDASLARSPGWRPAFRYYSMWISLLGALLCTTVMFIINWWTALVTFAVIVALFVYVHHIKPDVNWGSSTQAHVYRTALQSTLKLIQVEDHIKNFRPQILVLTGLPKSRPALVDFVWSLSKKVSLMMCGHVIIGDFHENVKLINRYKSWEVNRWLNKKKIRAFYSATSAENFRTGVQALMLNTGVGKLRPNVVMMGFMSGWRTKEDQSLVEEYFNVFHDAFDLQMGVAILRVKEGFLVDESGDCTKQEQEEEVNLNDEDESDPEREQTLNIPEGSPTMLRRYSTASTNGENETHASTPNRDMEKDDSASPLDQLSERFGGKKMRKGTIDVWWLFDDGGLTLLLPYILTTQSQWSNCKLRIFTAGTKRGEIDREQRQLATLLSKFRIDCKEMYVLPEIGRKPSEKSMKSFESLLEGWMLDEDNGETKDEFPWKVSEEDVILLKEKTQRNVRLSELLKIKSSEASLIVMTLPMPRKGTCPAGLYMAWLDVLTTGMPPILLLRGNQSSVLTFYS